MLALGVPPGLVMVAALLPILGVHLNTSQGCLTPAARRTALLAPLFAHGALMAAALSGFGQAPWWIAGLAVWLAGLILAARLTLTWWLTTQSHAEKHERVMAWLNSWAGGLVDPAAQCHVLVLAGNIDAARRLQPNLQPMLPHSIRYAMAYAAVQAASGTNNQDAFAWIAHRFPTHPHGALGLSDTLLAAVQPAADWAQLAQDLAGSSLWSRGLLPIADANLARAYAQAGDARATDVLNHALEAQMEGAEKVGPAVLHRLTLAAEACDHPAHTSLREQAERSDPAGLMGQTIQSGGLPSPVWL